MGKACDKKMFGSQRKEYLGKGILLFSRGRKDMDVDEI
jgi:hypothetical protein